MSDEFARRFAKPKGSVVGIVRLPVTRRGVYVSRIGSVLLTAGISAALVFAGFSTPAQAASPDVKAASDTKKVDTRPDRVSAMSTAQAQKSRVEDLSRDPRIIDVRRARWLVDS